MHSNIYPARRSLILVVRRLTNMLIVQSNRYSGSRAASLFSTVNVKLHLDQASIELPLSEDHDIDVCFAAAESGYSQSDYKLAHQVVSNLEVFDNIVQEACAADCISSGLHSSNFESYLTGIEVSHSEVSFLYIGAVVNTEWNEVFSLVDGRWVHTKSGTGKGSGRSVSL